MPLEAADQDGEALAVLLGRDGNIRGGFTLTGGGGTFDRLIGEGPAEQEGAAEPPVEAGYILLTHTEELEHGRIALIALVETPGLRLAGGWYQRYFSLRDIPPLLPEVTRDLAAAAESGGDKPKLLVLPFSSPGKDRTKLLTHLVSIDIARQGAYGVFPWSRVPAGPDAPRYGSGGVDPDYLAAVRRKTGAPYILTGDLVSMGTSQLLLISVLDTGEGNTVGEAGRDYRVLAEDLAVLPELAALLGEPPAEEPPERLVWIGGGTFIMGSPGGEISRDPDETQHPVTVKGFYLDKYEVTQEEYEAVAGSNPSRFKGAALPVEGVSWYDAVLYCNARSLREGLSPVYTILEGSIIREAGADGYRLPTEAEWEYACRAGTLRAFNRGETISPGEANYDGNYPYGKAEAGLYRGKTSPVGSFAPNEWGLYDMHGNVYEWCWTGYRPYTSTGDDGRAAPGVIRGGSWFSEGRFLRSANRARARRAASADYIGFRVARDGEA
jgi:formylglycine-generating enzyme required for sulfatase activity